MTNGKHFYAILACALVINASFGVDGDGMNHPLPNIPGEYARQSRITSERYRRLMFLETIRRCEKRRDAAFFHELSRFILDEAASMRSEIAGVQREAIALNDRIDEVTQSVHRERSAGQPAEVDADLNNAVVGERITDRSPGNLVARISALEDATRKEEEHCEGIALGIEDLKKIYNGTKNEFEDTKNENKGRADRITKLEEADPLMFLGRWAKKIVSYSTAALLTVVCSPVLLYNTLINERTSIGKETTWPKQRGPWLKKAADYNKNFSIIDKDTSINKSVNLEDL